MTAIEFWEEEFGEKPQTDTEKLACVMMRKYADQSHETGQVDAIVMPTLTHIRDSQLQRERDVMSYIAETIELMGGDDGPQLDTLKNWLYRMRKKALA